MIIFRADGNSRIGSGHVMRCLSIAREASKSEDVLFFSADCNFEKTIRDAGIAFKTFNTRYDQLEDELPQMYKLLLENNPSGLFIDSYFVTEKYLSEVKKTCSKIGCKLIYIDDMLSFPYPCDYLVNYNIFGLDKKEEYKKLYCGKSNPEFLLGPLYAPLRDEFRDVPLRFVNSRVENILVSTGGTDSEHIALKMVEEINRSSSKYHFHFIIGSKNNDFDQIKNIINKSDRNNVVLHRNIRNMAELMSKCDIAISAAGSTLYELCATQTPTLTYVLADNQILGAKGFNEHSIGIYIGDYRYKADFIQALFYELDVLAANENLRKKLASNMKEIVDGNGAVRILKEVFAD